MNQNQQGIIPNTLRNMSRADRRQYLASVDAMIAAMPIQCAPLPIPAPMQDKVLGLWQCKEYTATMWAPENPEATPTLIGRLSINKNKLTPDGAFTEGFTWETLQRVKRECGYADHSAVEVFPQDKNLVNVSNMRHLFIFKSGVTLPFEWRN